MLLRVREATIGRPGTGPALDAPPGLGDNRAAVSPPTDPPPPPAETAHPEADEVRPGRLVRALATVTTVAFLLPGTLLLSILAVLVSWIPPRGNAMIFVARVWSYCLLAAAGVRLDVEVDPAVEPGTGYVFLANHQSYFDIPALLATLPGTVRFAAKRSLFKIPIFGWALAAGGFIPVDRKDKSRAVEVHAAAGARLRAGISVLFFPEGTRSHDGGLGTFYRGGFLVAQKCGAPIVPVGISGSRQVLPRRRWSVQPGRIRVRLGAPVDTREYPVSRKRELIARVRDDIAELAGIPQSR